MTRTPRRLERSLVTPATSPKAFSGKQGDDFFDDAVEDASARKAALRERLHEAARKLHRAEQLAAGFAFGEGRGFSKPNANENENDYGDGDDDAAPAGAGFAPLRERLASLVAAADASASASADRPAFDAHARAVASWFADLQTALETCFSGSGSAAAADRRSSLKNAPLSERRLGAARGARGARRTRSAAASPMSR